MKKTFKWMVMISFAFVFDKDVAAQQLNVGERTVSFTHDNSTCISSETHDLRLWLSTMRLEREGGWFKEDQSANVIVGIRPVYRTNTPGTDAFPYKSSVNLRRGSGDLFVEGGLESGTIAEGFPLKSDDGHVGTIELSITLTKARGTSDEVKVMTSLINQVQSIQLPSNPYTDGFIQFSGLVSGFLTSLQDGPEDTRPIWSGRIFLSFSTTGNDADCEGELGTMKTGAFMVIAEPEFVSPSKLGDGYVPVTEVSSYCYRINNARTFVPRFGAKNADGSCPKYSDLKNLGNPYIGFVMLAEPKSMKTTLAEIADEDLLEAAPQEFASMLSEELKNTIDPESAMSRSDRDIVQANIALCEELDLSPLTCFGFGR